MNTSSKRPICHCIFCGARYEEPAKTCPSCHEPFPWNSIPDVAKETTSNRSGAALVAATVSLISVVVAMVQTYIIDRQSDLLQEQTRAAQTERAEALAKRIATTHDQILMIQDLQTALTARFEVAPPCGDACGAISFFTLESVSENHRNDSKGIASLTEAGQHLAHIRKILARQQEAMAAGANQAASPRDFFRKTIQPALTECGAGADLSKDLNTSFSSLNHVNRLIHGQIPALLDRQVALLMLSGGQNIQNWTTIEHDGSYTMRRLANDVEAYLDRLSDRLEALASICESRLAKDQQALGRVEAQI